MKVTFIVLRKDLKGVHNWNFLIHTPAGRPIAHYHVADSVPFPEAKKRVLTYLKNRTEPEVIVDVV